MFSIAYNKQTKYLVYWRYDNSTNVEKPTAQHHLSVFCDANNLDANNYSATQLPWNPKAQYVIGRDMFNEIDNSIYVDPNWVEPTPTLELTE
jgi:hypothetical protein